MNLQSTDHLLTTTRAVRKRLDFSRPVDNETILKCVEIATQAPSGSNSQGWHFLIVTDQIKREKIAKLYKKSFRSYVVVGGMKALVKTGRKIPGEQTRRVFKSAKYLADNMHQVPAMVIPCIDGRFDDSGLMVQASMYASIIPATWSLMLALRSRGIGTSWTTLHLRYESEIADMLGIPKSITQAALIPLAYYLGDDFHPAKRIPAEIITYWDSWGNASK